MKERELWRLTVEVLETFYDTIDDATNSPEDIADEMLAAQPSVAPQEALFVRECAAGVVRFGALCEGALLGYCDHLKRNRADLLTMHLIAYVMVFRYAELGGDKVRELFFRSTSAPRLVEFLTYLLDPAALRASAFPHWRRHYDEEFLEKDVLARLARVAPDARTRVVAWLDSQGAPRPARSTAAPSAAASTRCSDDEEETDTNNPNNTSGNDTARSGKAKSGAAAASSTSAAVEKTRARRRAAAAQAQRAPGKLPPAEVREMANTVPEPRPRPLASTSGSGAAPAPAVQRKKPTVPVGFSFHGREPASANRGGGAWSASSSSSGRAAGGGGSSPPPQQQQPAKDAARVRAMMAREVAVPTTTAALLREAHTLDQRAAERGQRLQEKERALRDSEEYERWRDEQEAQRLRDAALQVQQRHADALQLAERTAKAKREAEERRHAAAAATRAETERELARRERREAAHLNRQKGFVSNLRTTLAAQREEAVTSMQQDKASAARAVKEDTEEGLRRAKAADEQRQMEAAIVIQEIRMLRQRIQRQRAEMAEQKRAGATGEGADKGPATRARAGAPASPRGGAADDTLATMNNAELQAELRRVRAEQRALEETRRADIARARDERQSRRAELEAKLRTERARERQRREGRQARLAQTKEALHGERAEAENARMVEVHTALEARRRARLEEFASNRDAERQRRNELLLRAEDGNAIERQRWRQQEEGIINQITREQNRRW